MAERATQAADIALLRAAGIADPPRLVRLIGATINTLRLDLGGMAVLTEAASGPYAVTPVIAALAGAQRVVALTRDSRYAAAEHVVAQTRALQRLCGAPNTLELTTQRMPELFAAADIVTNLGFVRPIDASAVAAMCPGAAVPLMCEAWEFRPSDVDAAACAARGVTVWGTNEDFRALDIFAYSGWLCQKLLFDAQIEQHKCRVVIVSGDKFGQVIAAHLGRCGMTVHLLGDLRGSPDLANADAIVIADYQRDDMIVGAGGDVTPETLARIAPGATLIQFAGHVDLAGLRAAGIAVSPGIELGPRRMSVTLAGLGARPVVELHAAGLKVGELAVRAARGGDELPAAQRQFVDLMQPLDKVIGPTGLNYVSP